MNAEESFQLERLSEELPSPLESSVGDSSTPPLSPDLGADGGESSSLPLLIGPSATTAVDSETTRAGAAALSPAALLRSSADGSSAALVHPGEALLPLFHSLEDTAPAGAEEGSISDAEEPLDRIDAVSSSAGPVFGEAASRRRAASFSGGVRELGRLAWTSNAQQPPHPSAAVEAVAAAGAGFGGFSFASSLRGVAGAPTRPLFPSHAFFSRHHETLTSTQRSRPALFLSGGDGLRVLLVSTPPATSGPQVDGSLPALAQPTPSAGGSSPPSELRLKPFSKSLRARRKQRGGSRVGPFLGLLSVLAVAAVALPFAHRQQPAKTPGGQEVLFLRKASSGVRLAEETVAALPVSGGGRKASSSSLAQTRRTSVAHAPSDSLEQEQDSQQQPPQQRRRQVSHRRRGSVSHPQRASSSASSASGVSSAPSKSAEGDRPRFGLEGEEETASSDSLRRSSLSSGGTGEGGSLVLVRAGGVGGDASSSSSSAFAQSSQSANSSLASTPCESPPDAPTQHRTKRPLSFYRELTEKLRSMIREEKSLARRGARKTAAVHKAFSALPPRREATVIQEVDEDAQEEGQEEQEQRTKDLTEAPAGEEEEGEWETESSVEVTLHSRLGLYAVDREVSGSRAASPSTILQEPVSSSSDFGSLRRMQAPPPSPLAGESPVYPVKWFSPNSVSEEVPFTSTSGEGIWTAEGEPTVGEENSSPMSSSFAVSTTESTSPLLELRRAARRVVSTATKHPLSPGEEREHRDDDDEDSSFSSEEEEGDRRVLSLLLRPPPNTPFSSANTSALPTPTTSGKDEAAEDEEGEQEEEGKEKEGGVGDDGQEEEDEWRRVARSDAERLSKSLAQAAKAVEERPSGDEDSGADFRVSRERDAREDNKAWRPGTRRRTPGLSGEDNSGEGEETSSSESSDSSSCPSCLGYGVSAAASSSSPGSSFQLGTGAGSATRRRMKKRRDFRQVAERRQIHFGGAVGTADSESDGEVFALSPRTPPPRPHSRHGQGSSSGGAESFSPLRSNPRVRLLPSEWEAGLQGPFRAETLARLLRQRELQAALEMPRGTIMGLRSIIERKRPFSRKRQQRQQQEEDSGPDKNSR